MLHIDVAFEPAYRFIFGMKVSMCVCVQFNECRVGEVFGVLMSQFGTFDDVMSHVTQRAQWCSIQRHVYNSLQLIWLPPSLSLSIVCRYDTFTILTVYMGSYIQGTAIWIGRYSAWAPVCRLFVRDGKSFCLNDLYNLISIYQVD